MACCNRDFAVLVAVCCCINVCARPAEVRARSGCGSWLLRRAKGASIPGSWDGGQTLRSICPRRRKLSYRHLSSAV